MYVHVYVCIYIYISVYVYVCTYTLPKRLAVAHNRIARMTIRTWSRVRQRTCRFGLMVLSEAL